tara:strand:- start:592 stop:756 length:165 start_codon:yes stop_codon:yes gene_type:complete
MNKGLTGIYILTKLLKSRYNIYVEIGDILFPKRENSDRKVSAIDRVFLASYSHL